MGVPALLDQDLQLGEDDPEAPEQRVVGSEKSTFAVAVITSFETEPSLGEEVPHRESVREPHESDAAQEEFAYETARAPLLVRSVSQGGPFSL